MWADNKLGGCVRWIVDSCNDYCGQTCQGETKKILVKYLIQYQIHVGQFINYLLRATIRYNKGGGRGVRQYPSIMFNIQPKNPAVAGF